MFGKFVSKLIQSLPTWEITKYYGRVCIYQLKCIKYKVQTSEAWFNFKCKFMPGSLRKEIECEETIQNKVESEQAKQEKLCKGKLPTETTTYQKKSQSQYDTRNKENECSLTSFYNIKSSYIADEFLTTTKTKKTLKDEKSKENEDYSTYENYTGKKQRKVKHVQ